MVISDNLGSITKGLEATYILQVIKGLFVKDGIYLRSFVGSYYVTKSIGGNKEEIYPYPYYEGYIGKVITMVEECYDLIKYSYKVLMSRDYHTYLDESTLLNGKGICI